MDMFFLVSISNMFGFLGFYVPFMYLPSLVKTNLQSSGNFSYETYCSSYGRQYKMSSGTKGWTLL